MMRARLLQRLRGLVARLADAAVAVTVEEIRREADGVEVAIVAARKGMTPTIQVVGTWQDKGVCPTVSYRTPQVQGGPCMAAPKLNLLIKRNAGDENPVFLR